MTRAGIAVAVVAVLALLWLAGEQHRENCIREERANCSMLPWDNGDFTWESIDLGGER